MAVKLEVLPLMKGQGAPFGDLIPFSDYSRWERRPVKKPEPLPPKIRPKGHPREGLLQWTKQRVPVIQLQPADPVKSERAKRISSHASVLKQKLSSKPQEPDTIKLLKVPIKTLIQPRTTHQDILFLFRSYINA